MKTYVGDIYNTIILHVALSYWNIDGATSTGFPPSLGRVPSVWNICIELIEYRFVSDVKPIQLCIGGDYVLY
jgi:hypothetical protein